MKIVFKSIDQHLLLCTLTAFTSIANVEVTIPQDWPRMQAGYTQVEKQFDSHAQTMHVCMIEEVARSARLRVDQVNQDDMVKQLQDVLGD